MKETKKIKIADSSLSAVAGEGSIDISKTLVLHNVLHVPNLSCNLLSVSKLSQDLKYCVNISSNPCVFQDLALGKLIGNAKEISGLYYFEDGNDLRGQAQKTSTVSSFNFSDDEVMLWHRRLGHPSFKYLRRLFPTLFRKRIHLCPM